MVIACIKYSIRLTCICIFPKKLNLILNTAINCKRTPTEVEEDFKMECKHLSYTINQSPPPNPTYTIPIWIRVIVMVLPVQSHVYDQLSISSRFSSNSDAFAEKTAYHQYRELRLKNLPSKGPPCITRKQIQSKGSPCITCKKLPSEGQYFLGKMGGGPFEWKNGVLLGVTPPCIIFCGRPYMYRYIISSKCNYYRINPLIRHDGVNFHAVTCF